MSVSSSLSSPTRLIPVDPRVYCETMNEIHSYITSCKRGYLTQAELFRYYRQRHDNAEIPYRLLGYRSLLDLLSSDQRLFSIDLHREPACVYSAVKLRQQKRERRQGNTSFSRQHHSTNTLDEQHIPSDHYPFFDDQIAFNEQGNIQTNDEQEIINETQNERSLTPINHHHLDNNHWHTPQLDEQIPLMDKKNNIEESNEQTNEFLANSFVPLTTIRPSSDNYNLSAFIKCENQYKPIQRRILSSNDDYQENRRSSLKDPSIIKYSTGRLSRSISTSTTSLSKSNSIELIKSSIISLILVVPFIFLGLYLYKLCFI